MKEYAGLTSQEVEESRVLNGPNERTEKKRETLLQKIWHEIKNPLVFILIAAAILTTFLHEYVDTLIISIAVIVNIIVALVQQGKASEAYKLLQTNKKHLAVVIRNGHKQQVEAGEIVVGDIVVIESGLYVPADMEILEANSLSANQVIFTGEAEAQKKDTKEWDIEHIFDATNKLFEGTTIASGSGVARVVSVGENTEFAKIAQSLEGISKDKSPIEIQSERIARVISIIAGVIILLIVILGLVRDLPFYELALLAVSVAVSAVPEGLPSAITAILAYGATKIGKQGGLVKNLSSAQTLGSTDIIFTDKTGTLTFGDMSVSQIITHMDTGDSKERTIEHALLATSMFYDIEHKKFVGDDVDKAIGKYFVEGGEYVNAFIEKHTSVSEVPFSSDNKYYSNTREKDGSEVTYIKGAFSVIWEMITHFESKDGIIEPTEEHKKEMLFHVQTRSEQGKRILAVAHKEGEKTIFDGMLVMEDQLRPDAIDSVYQARTAGIIVVMITGDGKVTASRIAHDSGITEEAHAHVINGSEIDTYTDEDLYKGIRDGKYRVFSRVTPEHKLRLIELCSRRGMVVAMTGDGVNDSLALSKASIGISLSSATDVAKESSDLILTNDSFSGIIFALREGRRIASNITKTLIYLLSATFSIVFVIAASLILGLPLPFLPSHILWANILEEGLMNFAFLFEPNRSPQNKPQRIINKKVIRAITSISVFNGILFLGLYLGLFGFTETTEEVKRTVMFAALAVSALVLSWSVRSISGPLWRVGIKNNKFFVLATGINVLLFALVMATELGRSLLKLEVLSFDLWLVIIGFGVLNIMSVEVTKAVFWREKERDIEGEIFPVGV